MNEGINHGLDIPIHKGNHVVHVFADAVIGDSALIKVVGAYLFAPISRSDLTSSQVASFLGESFLFDLVKLGPQDGHGLDFVLLLATFVLASHGNAGWFELPTADDGEMIDDIVELGQKFVDMNSTTLAAIADQKVTNDESRAMKKVGYALIAQIQKVILTAEAMERIV